ncbi:MAG TPA: glycerophosphodiester phosphodiesterase [Gemmatimonadetes bacterium]|nr:glycerophosphodiester phosphodiesterase [Gemmatimonadota bacterium]
MKRVMRPGCPFLAGSPLFIAHRGGAKVAPENTMEAFRLAVESWGADVLETDARLTSDGEVVLIHDSTVGRTCDGEGNVAEMTWNRLRDLDAGFHFRDIAGETSYRGRGVSIPSFDEVLDTFPHTRVNVETKCRKVARPLAEIVRRHRARDRVLIAAEVEAHRTDVRGYGGPWGASRRDIAFFWSAGHLRLTAWFRPGFDVLQVPEVWHGIRVVTPRFVSEAHRLNLAVHVWVVDEEEDMTRLLAWGVDGIQTDRPDVLSSVLEGLGRVPSPKSLGADR